MNFTVFFNVLKYIFFQKCKLIIKGKLRLFLIRYVIIEKKGEMYV